jgi:hypothetical protein
VRVGREMHRHVLVVGASSEDNASIVHLQKLIPLLLPLLAVLRGMRP